MGEKKERGKRKRERTKKKKKKRKGKREGRKKEQIARRATFEAAFRQNGDGGDLCEYE